MKFVWNEEKAIINQKKDGISFSEAQTVFEDYHALRIYDPDHSEGEDRFFAAGAEFCVTVVGGLPLLP